MMRVPDQMVPNQLPGQSRVDAGKLTYGGALALNGKTPVYFNANGYANVQAVVVGTAGNVSATVELWGSNNGLHFILIDTLAVASAATPSVGGKELVARTWSFIYAKVSVIAGTGAAVDVYVKPIHEGAN